VLLSIQLLVLNVLHPTSLIATPHFVDRHGELMNACRLIACIVLVLGCLESPTADAKRKKSRPQFVELDGLKTRVVWNDGDSFRVIRGRNKEMRARIVAYNTLESYGPVHFWGDFDGWQLYDIAKKGTEMAKGTVWRCESVGDADGYGRRLVSCPDLTDAILRAGLAHVFAIGAPADPAHLEAQREAQNERRGIWRGGIPATIVTSIHSTSEDTESEDPKAYNRACDTRTGRAYKVEHKAHFDPCDAWCHGASCMLYVPFKLRYGAKRPACLREGKLNRLVLPENLHNPLQKTR
jgi:endonuclease YncB( thermonuclease family)